MDNALAISTSCCLADADVHNLGIRVFGKSHTIEQLLRLGTGLVPVDYATLGLLVADEDVLRNGQERLNASS